MSNKRTTSQTELETNKAPPVTHLAGLNDLLVHQVMVVGANGRPQLMLLVLLAKAAQAVVTHAGHGAVISHVIERATAEIVDADVAEQVRNRKLAARRVPGSAHGSAQGLREKGVVVVETLPLGAEGGVVFLAPRDVTK